MSTERTIGGRYTVGRKIAEGGMGSVHEATHVLSKKVVALKLLDPSVGRDETTRQRFLREVAAPAHIGHDGIVEIYDAGFDPGENRLFVAMELLTGETLRGRLMRGGMTQPQVLDLFEQMLEPLAAAHRAGIVHRDLKPENVFLARKRDGVEVVKILDFGIARDLGGQDTVTQAGTAMGTPHYMSPEQAMSARDVSFTTDVWALGVILYEALSGAPPFAGETIATIVVEICTKPHRPLVQVAPSTMPAIAALVDRCLDKDATKRPTNAAELLAALRQARGGAAAMPAPAAPTREYAPTLAVSASTYATPPPAAVTAGAQPAPTYATPPPGSTQTPTVSGRAHIPATAAMPMPQITGPMTPTGLPATLATPGGVPPTLATPGGTPSLAPRLTPPIGGMGSTPPPGMPPMTPASVAPAAPGSYPGPSSVPSAPGYAPAPARPARPAWMMPVAILAGLGCLGVGGIVFLGAGLAVLGAVVGGDAEVDGELTVSDGLVGRGTYGDTYDYDWSSGEHVVLQLTSPDFDTVLVVRTPSGREIINDDQGFGNLNSRIDMVADQSGEYVVTVTSYAARTTGRYHLSVQTP